MAVCLGLAISQTTCGMYSIGSQFSSASSTESPLLSGIVSLVTRLLVFWSSLPRLQPALVADLSARHPRGTLWCHMLALPLDRIGLSRLWVLLFGMVFPLAFVLCLGTFPVPFINSSRLSSLSGPGLGAPLSSYLEGALYKLLYIYILMKFR